jgi:carbon monoxide dehydrogenase subunit G
MIGLQRVVELAAGPSEVWRTLWDVPALARCIPGCGDVETAEAARRYRATVRDRVGPFTIAIPLEIVVDSALPLARLAVTASGRDSTLGSPVTVRLTASLEPTTAGGTRLAIEGTASVGGKLAALGQAVIQRRTRDILDQFANNLTALLTGPTDTPLG